MTDSYGRVLIPIKNITPGTYNVELFFNGGDAYNGSSVVMHLIVGKVSTNLIAPSVVNKIYNKVRNITITLRDDE